MLPLKNKTVLITRSENQATEFIHQLQNLGANTISLPLIENTAINQSELIEKVNQSNYDWIIFTSTNAVKFFFEVINPEKINSKIAVVGSKTAEVLKDIGVDVDFTPSKFTAKQLANEIPVSVNDTVLIPRSNLAKNDILEILATRNCVAEAISIYANTSINYSKKELDKVFNQKIDFITFTSGSTVESFVSLGIELNQAKVICIGPETALVAEEKGLKVAAIATPYTVEGMVEAITVIAKNEE